MDEEEPEGVTAAKDLGKRFTKVFAVAALLTLIVILSLAIRAANSSSHCASWTGFKVCLYP